jgi:predicted DNA-binding antitoxin AbrB/MazE fold protein
MTEVINAVFKNGVFRPLEKIEMKEHEKVIIKILSLDQWQTGFNRVIEKIHKSMKGSGLRVNTGG